MNTQILELDDFAEIRADMLQVTFKGETIFGTTPAGVRASFTPICATTGRGVYREHEPARYEPAPGEITERMAGLLDELVRVAGQMRRCSARATPEAA
jgi:hypothetical protein